MSYKVAMLIGSESDREVVEHSIPYFEYFGISCDLMVLSAHRNPDKVVDFANNARQNEYKILIGGAGMAAHLAGALKANSSLPVIGIPLKGGVVDGLDSLLSTVQMPKGVPVATMSTGKSGAINAAILSAEIFSLFDDEMLSKIEKFRTNGYTLS